MLTIDLIQIVVHADGRIPGAKHDRSLAPTDVTIDQSDDAIKITIAVGSAWTTAEPSPMGPLSKLWQNLQGKKVLDAKRFPTIVFESSSLNIAPEKITAKGSLQIKDVQRNIALTAQRDSQGKFNGSLPIKLSDYGIKKFKALLGTIWLSDDAEIFFSVRVD